MIRVPGEMFVFLYGDLRTLDGLRIVMICYKVYPHVKQGQCMVVLDMTLSETFAPAVPCSNLCNPGIPRWFTA
jgi:hypothetical protein